MNASKLEPKLLFDRRPASKNLAGRAVEGMRALTMQKAGLLHIATVEICLGYPWAVVRRRIRTPPGSVYETELCSPVPRIPTSGMLRSKIKPSKARTSNDGMSESYRYA